MLECDEERQKKRAEEFFRGNYTNKKVSLNIDIDKLEKDSPIKSLQFYAKYWFGKILVTIEILDAQNNTRQILEDLLMYNVEEFFCSFKAE